ncbi:MAG: hypothetical protein IJV27_00850 [Prevotella sp.]|nr:hypothetical protein [Prevotella sp.]
MKTMKMTYMQPETEVILINLEEMMQIDLGSGKVNPGDAEGKQNDFDFEEDVVGNTKANVWDD